MAQPLNLVQGEPRFIEPQCREFANTYVYLFVARPINLQSFKEFEVDWYQTTLNCGNRSV